jgi:hypothetical protein
LIETIFPAGIPIPRIICEREKKRMKKSILFSAIAWCIGFSGLSQTQAEMNEQAGKDFKKSDATDGGYL